MRDITERKLVEEELLHAEERFRLVVDGVRDYAIFMLDPEGNGITWNAGAEQIKGYTAEEIVGRHFTFAGVIGYVAAAHTGQPGPEGSMRAASAG